MSVADKTLHLCIVQRHDAARRARRSRARSSSPARLPCTRCSARRSSRAFADDARGRRRRRLHAGSAAASATSPRRRGKTQTIRFVNIRETGGWSAEARAATPKIAALLAMAALPEPEPVPRVGYKSDGQLLIVGPADAALHWAERADGPARRDRARSPAARSAPSCRPSATIPVYSGKLDRALGLARRVRRRMGAGESDRSRPLHALQRVHPRLPRAGDRLELPDRSRPLPRPSPVRRRLRRDRRDRFRPRSDARAQRALRPRARSAARRRGSRCTSRRRATSPRAPIRSRRRRPSSELATRGRRVREAEISSATRRRSARTAARSKTGCTQCIDVCSTRGDPRRRRPHHRRAAPVHGLRRLHDRLPVGRDDATRIRRSPTSGARMRTLLATYAKAGGRDACLLLHAADGRAAIARSRAAARACRRA